MRATFLFAFSCCALLAASAQAQTNLASEGRAIAARQCGECHAINRGDTGTKDAAAPSFAAIAAMPSTTLLSIKVFLRSPHANMPHIMFADSELDAIADHILSLRGN